MSAGEARKIDNEAVGEAAVAAFLRAHPEFFTRHHELLAALELPHPCGGAVSLLEYQVGVLRDQNLHLRRRLETLLAAARENEQLGARLHRLTLELLAAADLDQVLAALYAALDGELNADLAAVRLLAGDGGSRRPELAPEPGARALCAPVFEADAPLCGPLAPDLGAFLFGERAGEVGSAVLLALGEVEPVGVLAVASRDPERYHPGMGTLFVRQLAEVAGTVIARHLRGGGGR